MFEDDIEIKIFLELTHEFSNSLIDQEDDNEDGKVEEIAEDEIAGHKIIELKSNFIPKGLVPLERIFLKDDTPLKPVVQSSEENVADCNIGTAEHPGMVKISKALTTEQRNRYIKLLKEHVEVFHGLMKN